jgi:NADH:ubiquinone oxidoreductase subunit 2 (subunit N)
MRNGDFSDYLIFSGNVQMIESCIIIFSAINLLFFIYLRHKDNDNFVKILILLTFSIICILFVIISKNFLLIFTGFSLFILTIFQLVSVLNMRVDRINQYIVEYFLRGTLTVILFLYGFSLLFGATDFKDFSQILMMEHIENPLIVLGLVVFGVALYQYFFLFPFQGPYMKLMKRSDSVSVAIIWFLYFPAGIFILLKLSVLYNYFLEKNNILLSAFSIVIACVCLIAGNMGAIKTKSMRRIMSFLFLSFTGIFLLNISMFSTGIITEVLMNRFNFINIFMMLTSFMPLYVIFSDIEKNMADDSINNIRGLGRINKYAGANLVIIFLSWSGIIYYLGPFIKYFNTKDFLQMGALNIITLAVLLAAFAFFFLNVFRIIFQVFKKPAVEATQKILFSKFLYVYITFYSLIIIIGAVLVFLKIINIDISFMNFEISEFNF